jgi:transposase
MEITKKWLIEQYIVNGRKQDDIANELGCSRKVVQHRLKKYNIRKRSVSEMNTINLSKEIPKKIFIELYVEQKMSLLQIANKFNKSENVITNLRKFYGIDIIQNENKLSDEKIIELFKKLNTIDKVMDISGYRNKKRISNVLNNKGLIDTSPKFKDILTKDFLKKEYVEKRKSATNIGNEVGISYRTVIKYIEKYGFEKRDRCEQNKNIDSEKYTTDWFRKNMKTKNAYEICEQLGVSTTTLYRHLHDIKLVFPKQHISSPHKKIVDEISKIYNGKIVINDRELIKPYELDIYLPELEVGIEYNGLYWHSTKFKDQYYHVEKLDMCKNKGVRLIQIWEHHMLDKPHVVLDIINHMLGVNKKLYARKLHVKQLSFHSVKDFLYNNHLKYPTPSSINLALCDDVGNIYSVMTFKNHKCEKLYYEIERMCTKNGYSIIGGTQKLFKYFIRHFDPNKVLSYCDLSYFNGLSYENMGFTNKGFTNPNYLYSNRAGNVLTRQQCQKHKLVDQGFDKDKSENMIMEERGYLKVYDCGSARYVWNKT